jgi:uncharacterized membrane protein
MYSGMHVVAMGSKGVAMTGGFLVIILALLIVGLFTYRQARRRDEQDDAGRAGRDE